MARRDRLSVSLFPFMSVLACTIGALVMLLAVMSLSAVGAKGASEQAWAESRASARAAREALEIDREALEAAEALWARVDEELEARGLTAGVSASTIDRDIERTLAQRDQRATLARLERQRRKLDSEREGVETTIEVLESRRETLPILIDPTGLSPHYRPFFIVCDEGGATLYRASDDFQYFVQRESISSSGEFGRYLRRTRAEPGALLVLLVRPDGIDTCSRVTRIGKNAGIRVARLPLPGNGELDWSLLRRAEGRR